MKIWLSLLCFAVGAFVNHNLQAQSVLSLCEITQSNKVYTLTPVLKKGSVKAYPNVDINSRVEIKIDKNALKDEASKYLGLSYPLPFERMRVISQILVLRNKILEDISFDSKNSLEERKEKLADVSAKIMPLLSFVYELPADNELRKKALVIFSEREPDASKTYDKFFTVVEDEINRINEEYAKAVEKSKICFSLAGFLNNTPVHLEGFDIIKPGEYYKAPTFVTSIPDSARSAFNRYKALAGEASADFTKTFKVKFREMTGPLVEALEDTIAKMIEKPLEDFKKGIESVNKMDQASMKRIDEIKRIFENLQAEIEKLKAGIQAVNDENYLINAASGINSFLGSVQLAREEIKTIVDQFSAVSSKELKTAIQNFTAAYSGGLEIVEKNIEALRSFNSSKLSLSVSISNKIKESLLKLNNDVKKIPVENVPEITTLDLCYTGYRKEGDKLFLKAVLGKKDADSDNFSERTIEFIPLGLYKIGFHNSINAVLIFADNTSVSFPTNKQFQLAPSYSVLFKFGTRKSNFYNPIHGSWFGYECCNPGF